MNTRSTSIFKDANGGSKPWLQSHCDTSYSRGGVNQMWILKNSKDLGPSPPAIALTYLTSLPFTRLFLTLS